MSFNSLLGQDLARHILINAITSGNLNHAYLFYGPPGIGKQIAAIELAKAINCDRSSDEPDYSGGCDQCTSCHKIDQAIHPDVLLVQPEKKDGARVASIKIETIRDLQKRLGFLPYEGRYKVAIINDAELMNPQAANAFLKTLEEPPSSTILILIAGQAQQLMPTIHSRCQAIPFHPLPDDAIKTLLKQKAEEGLIPEDEIPIRVQRGRGEMQKALDENLVESTHHREALIEVLKNISWKRQDLIFSTARNWGKQTDEVQAILDELAGLIRDISFLGLQCSSQTLYNPDLTETLASLAGRKTPSSLIKMHEAILNTKQALKGNANTQLAIENLLIDFCQAA